MYKPGNQNLLSGIFKTEFVRHSFFLFLGSSIALLLSLALYPVFSRMYSPEQFGVFGLFTSITGIVSLLASGVYEQAILLPKNDTHARSLALLAMMCTVVISLVVFFISLFFRNVIAQKFFNTPEISSFLLWVPVSVILGNIYAIFISYSNRNKYFSFISQCSINQGIGVNISKLLFGLFNYTNYGLILGRLIGQLTSAIQLVCQVLRKVRITAGEIPVAWNNIKEVAVRYKNFPVFSMPLQLINAISTTLPIFVLSKFFTVHDAGQYSLAAGVLLTPVQLLTGSVSKVLNQSIVERVNQQAPIKEELFKWLRILMPVTAVLFILFFFVSRPVFVLLFGIEWQEAGSISGILLPWVFLVLFTFPISFIPDIFFKQRKALIIDIVYLIVRMVSLGIGVYYKDVILAIILFVISGCIVLTYNFVWYLSLLKNYGKNIKPVSKSAESFK
ncbi:MAG TPA: oligosaccharide flippase family protein [Bacteroidales bacterium]|nr:oligosaccharide flippase family protein [Bacteroidales bacterium]